jgi:outer membrane biogenesis lipoprotein LolB
MNGIQQLRKSAGLELKDAVELFYQESNGTTVLEDAVGLNVPLFELQKLRWNKSVSVYHA